MQMGSHRMAVSAQWLRNATLLAFCLLCESCTVGPDFRSPPQPAVSDYVKASPGVAAGTAIAITAQRLDFGQDIPGQWWTLFHSEPLDALIKQALKDNPDLQSSQAALRVAMENMKAQEGLAYPAASASAGISRNKNAAELSPTLASSVLLYNLYQTQLSVSWTPDIWGGNRRQAEALKAEVDAQRFQVQATYVALTASIVAAAIQEASLREQIAATDAVVDDERQILAIEERQKALGEVAGADVAAQQVLLAQTEQTLPPMRKLLTQQRDLLAALAGRLPAEEITQTFDLQALSLPGALPVSLPSKLVEHRADIRAAEETLHAASAEIGVATANMLPDITLSATGGSVATELGRLVSSGNGFWSLGAGVTQPLFDGGTLMHRARAARATYDQAAALYRGTVIAAFQNVADILHAIQADEDNLAAADVADAAASRSLAIARKQAAFGQVSRVVLLNAEQARQQTYIAVIQAEANRLADSAALFEALGGGWWNRKDQIAGTASGTDEKR